MGSTEKCELSHGLGHWRGQSPGDVGLQPLVADGAMLFSPPRMVWSRSAASSPA